MYNVMSEAVEVLHVLGQGYCLQYFFGEFAESRCGERKGNGLLAAGLYGVMKLGMNRILPSGFASTVVMGKQVLHFILLCALALCFYRAVRKILVFLVITFMAVSEITFFLAYMILVLGQKLTDLWLHLYDRGYFASADTFISTVEMSLTGLQFLMTAACIGLLYVSLRKIAGSYREKDYALSWKERAFILTPGLAALLLCILLRLIMITVEGDVPRLLYDRFPPLLWLVPAILLLSLLSILYSIQLFQDILFFSREKNSRIILEKQIGSLQEHIRETERIYSGIRSMKHDMKNTLAVILRLAAEEQGKENGELQAYLAGLSQTMEGLELQFNTGNTVVDALLNMKYHEAVRRIPDIQMDAERLLFSDTFLVQSYDLGIILGNALDNAIEACRKLKEKEPEAEAFIRLSSFQKGKMVLMEIANSFDGKVIWKRQSQFPETDKADREAHGIGLVNIRNAAERYHGGVDWEVHNRVFTLTVMLQNERRVQ